MKDITDENKYTILYNNEPKNLIKNFPIIANDNQTLINKIKEKLPRNIDWYNSEDFISSLNKIYLHLHTDYIYIWFKYLNEAKPDINTDTADRALTVMLRDLLKVKCENNPIEGRKILEKLVSNEYTFPIFIKITLLCIDKNWNEFSDLFEIFLKSFESPFEETNWEVELHSILKNRNNDFNQSLIEDIKNKINTIPEYYKEKGEETEAYWQYKWLSPLKDNPEFFTLYKDAISKTKLKKDEPYEPCYPARKMTPLGKDNDPSSGSQNDPPAGK